MQKMYTAQELEKQLWQVAYEPEAPFTLPLGPEIECFVYDNNRDPIDLTKYLELISEVPNVWDAGTDLGLNMLEIACEPQHTLGQYINSLHEVFYYLSKTEFSRDWLYQFSGTAKETIGRIHSPRYDAAIQALIQEYPENGKRVEECMTNYAAFQINVGVKQVGGVFSEQAKKLLYAFANWGPALCVYFESLADDVASKRLSDAYTFASEARGMKYMDWEFCNNLEEELFSVPQLLRQEPGDVYTYFGERPTTLSALHTGTIYWPCRPQGINDKMANRIEKRTLSAMTPVHSVRALRILNQLVTYVLDVQVQHLPVLTEKEWKSIQLKKNSFTVVREARDFLEMLPILL